MKGSLSLNFFSREPSKFKSDEVFDIFRSKNKICNNFTNIKTRRKSKVLANQVNLKEHTWEAKTARLIHRHYSVEEKMRIVGERRHQALKDKQFR